MVYDAMVWVVPTGKMRARYASWKHEQRVKASTSTKAVAIVMKYLRPQLKEDKYLRYALRKGGINIRITAIGKEVKASRRRHKEVKHRKTRHRPRHSKTRV